MHGIEGIEELADKYDVFILDQYGVLHNGTDAYPGAIACLERLVASKTVIILSNTSRRAIGIAPKLAALGFSTGFHGAVTGGEEAYLYLKQHCDKLQKCALMTYDVQKNVQERHVNTETVFHGLNVAIVPIKDADFLLVEGTAMVCYSDRPEEALRTQYVHTGVVGDHIQTFLNDGLRRNLPLLCTNPDHIAALKDGQIAHMGGGIARVYEEMGGRVIYFGKPEPKHFETCIRMANASDNRSRIVHVGDSLHHDIQGANNAQIDSVWITGGIHANELEQQSDRERLCTKYQVDPTYILRQFQW